MEKWLQLSKNASKSKISNYQPPGFPSINGIGKFVLAIMQKQKNGSNSPKAHPKAKLPITDPLKFGPPVFQVSTEIENLCWLL